MRKKKTSPKTRVQSGSVPGKEDPERPSRLTVLVAVLTFAGLVLTIAAAPPWAAAAAIVAAGATCALHGSVWQSRPSLGGLATVLTLTVIGSLAAHFAFESSADHSPLEASVGRTLLSPGVGQIERGNIVRASLSGASGSYSDPLIAHLDSTVTVAIRLSNGGPDDVVGTRVSASLPNGVASSLSVGLVARPRNAHPPSAGDTATIEIEGDEPGCIAYVPGSTRLYDQHFGLISDLPDGIAGTGVSIGSVGVSIEDTRFISLDLKLISQESGSGCG